MESNKEADITIYHNGLCSKCNGALEILQRQNIPHTVRWYLADPLTKEELQVLLTKIGVQPSALVRMNEDLYKERYEGKHISEEEWLTILAENPVLLQRPIVEKGSRAIIVRPPERIFEIL